MGATGQPAGSAGRSAGTGGSGSRFGRWWDTSRNAVFAVFGTGAVICAGFMEVVDRSIQIPLLAALVVLALAGLSSIFRARTYARLAAAVWAWVRGHRILVIGAGALALSLGVGGAVMVASGQSCEDATEVAVMVPEYGAPGFAAAADAFEQDSTTPFACPRYHVTTFGVGWPALRAAFASGWGDASAEDDEAAPVLGPRPAVWIAESRAQADIVASEALTQDVTISGRTLVAGSPLVLAVPEAHAKTLRATIRSDDTAKELIAAAGTAGLSVVRANPDTSFAAALHTVGLYGDSDGIPSGGSDAESLELDLGHALEQAGLPLGTDGALLCRLRELSTAEPPRVAVLTTERAMLDGGAACPASSGADDAGTLVPFYPGSPLGLDYTAVRLDWAEEESAGRRAEAAEAFVEWLGTTEGQTVLDREAKVRGLAGRPPSGDDGPLPGLQGAPVVEPGASVVAYTRVLSTEERYRTARRPARVLVLVDSSASMGRPADGDRKRIDVARRGVLGALGHLSGSDQVGVWRFSGAATSSPQELLGLTSSQTAQGEAPEHLGRLRPSGYTPLYDAIDAGTSHLIELDTGAAARRPLTALVVLTDGENRPGRGAGADLSASDLIGSARAAADSGVRVYVVAVGEASCQVSDLQQIAAEWDGECWDSSFGELESTLGSLFGQLGGR
ncbi:vWA domain-containing protein [Promicromonospora panici]|uniref:vWA domain-containing protein n=1 Tax=Promicromonospora panici TaxID=2219658 RepID=UPI00101C1F86|nr:vWA domain-containing protein [Promicromonospora panici]